VAPHEGKSLRGDLLFYKLPGGPPGPR